MLNHYVQLHAHLLGSMCALLHSYLKKSIFCLSLRLPALPLYALGHNNETEVCASGGCAFAQALLICLCLHINRQVCLIRWHVFQIVFWDFVPEAEVISCRF